MGAMDDGAKRAILTRRGRFVTATLASAGLVVAVADCGGKAVIDAEPAADGGGGTGGTPQPCLGAAEGGEGGSPQACLDLVVGGAGGAQPCLAPLGGAGGT